MIDLETLITAGDPVVGCPVVSCHTHVGEGWNHPMHGSDAEHLLATMDRVGVSLSCVSAMRAIAADMVGGNAEVAELVRRHPGRFLGTVVANPYFPDESRQQLEQHFASGLFGMIKIHPEFHAYPMDGPGYRPVFAFADEHRIPVLTHSWGVGRGLDHPSLARGIAVDFPDMPFVLGHAGGVPEGVHASVAVARDAPSVYLDTATSMVYRGAIEHMVEEVGASRVLFGTDAPYLADAPQVARVAGARIDEADKRAILGANLLGLLRASAIDIDLNLDLDLEQ